MALKQVARSATVAFSPVSDTIALGTMAGAIDLSFSSSATMELFSLDLSGAEAAAAAEQDFPTDPSQMLSIGSVPAGDRFNRLTWGQCALDKYPQGVIAGGQVDGVVTIWDPAKIASGKAGDSERALITKLTKHKGAVRGLEFNPHLASQLASGAEDGELCVWDLANPAAPTPFPSLKAGGGSPQGEISFLSWNLKVHHILGTTSYSSPPVVWDLRKQKPVISLTDPVNRRRCSCLQWNPEIATQLVVASDDDRFPALQVWDLRNATSPVNEFRSHSKGVLAMAWCPFDSGLLLSCSKDNRTICWEANTGEVLCELPAGANWNFDVAWSTKIPGVLSTSSFDGKVSIYNIESASKAAVSDSDFGAAISNQVPIANSRAPKWLKRPNGCSFGFGGKLVSFNSRSTQVHVRTLVTEESLVVKADELEVALAGPDKKSLEAFCEHKASSTSSEEEREIWSFLAVLFDEDARRKLLTHLDFPPVEIPNRRLPPPKTEEEVQAEANAAAEAAAAAAQEQAAAAAALAAVPEPLPEGAEEDFFEKLQLKENGAPGAPEVLKPTANGSAGAAAGEGAAAAGEGEGAGAEEEEEEEAGSEGSGAWEDSVQRALVVGDYEAAVECCIAAGRAADALVLASVGGFSDLWTRTQAWYLKRNRKPYMKVVDAVVNNSVASLVASRPLSKWRETLAILCTYGSAEEWSSLCEDLASRLEQAGDARAATLVYMCAGAVGHVLDLWAAPHQRLLDAAAGAPGSSTALGDSTISQLQDLVEKAVVLGMATGQRGIADTSGMSALVSEYACLLAGQGRLGTALSLLSLVTGADGTTGITAGSAAVLKDRIYHSGQVHVDPSQGVPPSPFSPTEQVPLAPAPSAPAYQASHLATTHQSAAAQSHYQASSYTQTYQQPPVQNPYVPASDYPQTSIPSPTTHSQPSYAQTFVPTPAPIAPAPVAPPPSVMVPQQPAPPSRPPGMFMPSQPPPSMAMPGQPPQPPSAPPSQPAPFFVPKAVPPPDIPPPHSVAAPPVPQAPSSRAPTFQPRGPPPSVAPISPMKPQGPPPGVTAPPAPQPTFRPAAPPPGMAAVPQQPALRPTAPPPGAPVGPPGQPLGGAPLQPGIAQPAPVAAPAAPAPAAPPPAPPATIQTADTSNVAAELRPVVGTLSRIFSEASGAMAGPQGNPAKRRELEANSKKLGALFVRLNARDVSASVGAKLVQLCAALDNRDYAAALRIQVELTTKDWDECSSWLTALKSLIKMRQLLG